MTTAELDIISRMRGEIYGHRVPTGENLFLVWGYPTAFFLLVEFAALMLWKENWCNWIWMGIPLVGAPLMIHFLRKDYDRTGNRSLDAKVIDALLYVSGDSRWLWLFPHGRHSALPSQDGVWHCGHGALLRQSLLPGRPLAVATAHHSPCHCHHPHHSWSLVQQIR